MSAIARLPSPLPPGVPSESAYVRMYCELRGVPLPSKEAWSFHVALAIFRAAGILAGVHARSLQGNASAANAASVGSPAIVDKLACAALDLLPERVKPVRHAPPNQGDSVTLAAASNARLALWPRPPSARVADLLTRLTAFMSQHIAPADAAFAAHAASTDRWQPFPHMESLKNAARTEGLWNLWICGELAQRVQTVLADCGLSASEAAVLRGPALTNTEYAHLAKAMGSVPWCPEVFNCSAPDTGNMEVLARYGSAQQQREWLLPLLRGDVRSCFAMTEPDVASSDATNIQGASKHW